MTQDFYLGYFGLSAVPVNITSYADRYPIVLGSLRASNLIPSSAWGYIVGASYRAYPSNGFASLTFGGYDASRFDATKNVTSSGQDAFRQMLLSINSITYNSSTNSSVFSNTPITAGVDSTVTQMWLPEAVCQSFEEAFSITWNSTSNLYIIDDRSRFANQALNPSVTFTLSSGSNADKKEIDLTPPLRRFRPQTHFSESIDYDGNYLPLRRAQNDTQYLLGRAFLQEAYLISDFERAQFSIFPAIWPDSNIKSNILPILPPPRSVEADGTSSGNNCHIDFSTPAIIGTIVGSASILLIAALAVLKRHSRGRLRRAASSKPNSSGEDLRCPTPELEAVTEEMKKAPSVRENVVKGPPTRSDTLNTTMSDGTLVEKDGCIAPMELAGKEKVIAEVTGDDFAIEMGARPHSVYGLEGG